MDKVILNQALALQDINICDQIVDNADSVSCKQGFYLPSDKDQDGLNDLAEQYYDTQIDNSDSDGDGYLDGEEVENGYNPLGEGRMEGKE